MLNPRKGLKRYGMRSYIVRGPRGCWEIERERRNKFYVGPAPLVRPSGFFAQKFNRLCEAREFAEQSAGIEHAFDPVEDCPRFLLRIRHRRQRRAA